MTTQTTKYKVFFAGTNDVLAPSLTGLDEDFVFGSGYYVVKVEGPPRRFKVTLVEGPYDRELADVRAEELNLTV